MLNSQRCEPLVGGAPGGGVAYRTLKEETQAVSLRAAAVKTS